MAFTTIDVLKNSLRLINVLDASQPLNSTDRNDALRALNSMVNSWLVQYNHLWLKNYATVLMEANKQSYLVGTDRIIEDGKLFTPKTTAALATNDTVMSVTSATGISVGNDIGVYLDSGAFHWTTVASISGLDITLTAGVPSAAASGNQVYSYTEVISRALRIQNATYINRVDNGGEIPLEQWSRREYTNQPQKSTSGSASAFYYSPQLGNGLLYVWPTASNNLNVMRIDYTRPFEKMVDNDDELDFPDEWQDAVEYNLAARLATQFGVTPDRAQALKAEAESMLSACLAWDNEGVGMSVEVESY